MTIEPFELYVPQHELDSLQRRLGDVHVSMGVALMEGPNILSDKLFELMTTTIEYANLVENYVNGGVKSNNLGRVEDQMHDQKVAYIDLARKQLSLD